jgi:nitrite reductase (NADH) large subunit
VRLVVIGNGMVGHRFLTRVQGRGLSVTTFCEEPRPAYDRVNLTAFFSGKSAEDLSLLAPGDYDGMELHFGDKAVAIDRNAKAVTSARGKTIPYDKLVLATGSSPFVPPIPGRDSPGCFVYRTLDDLEAIRERAKNARVGAVIGGGLLGLEAANALKQLGLEVHVIEFAPRLMALQLDEIGGALLKAKIEALGVSVHTGKSTTHIEPGLRMNFSDGESLETDLIVFSAGIRPRDELARAAGLTLGERGGIAVDDRCCTSDPDIFAIGECALHRGRIYGLVAPGYRMAEVAADAIAGDDIDRFTGCELSTKLKLLGVDVASFGDAFNNENVVSWFDALKGVYKKLAISADKKRLLGGILVGDASDYGPLLKLQQSRAALPPHVEDLMLSQKQAETICSCLNVTKSEIVAAIEKEKCVSVGAIKACTGAGTGCGSCVPLLAEMLRSGDQVQHLCEHFPHSRQDLFHLLRLHSLKTFDDLLARHGRGAGCEICKPAVASMLASTWNEHVLSKPHLSLQDTNDRFLANIQRDGTYSVVPRVPGGEITPEKLIALGQVAKRYGLYTKITGAQRIDLLGARVEQLPLIWRELVDAGFESGHAYGKALRTVKSCVGSTWCRYGVQDSVSFAIRLENRYKGLRSPHKLKSAVSGCARECAEAQGKDFGVIATEKGYNLYLCGNGGMKPAHAQLFATDLDEETVVKYLDRFLMFYIRTADRLQRTAPWLRSLDGGIEYLKKVLIDDSLGICAELEADMARVVGSYRCEWKAALEDPEKLARFRPFVNGGSDPSIVFIRQREQHRPATWEEKKAG